MKFKPIDLMWDRVEVSREESDTSLFLSLLFLGELITKLVATGLVSMIEDDHDSHQYRLIHKLVRADGLGEWNEVIHDVLVGPASQFLMPPARDEQRELTQRLGSGTWQYDSVKLMNDCLKEFDKKYENLPAKVDGRR